MTGFRPAAPEIKRARTRLAVGTLIFAVALGLVAVRLVDLAAERPSVSASSRPQLGRHPVGRGDILDRNGRLLATSLPSRALFARPKQVGDIEGAAAELAQALPWLSAEEVAHRLSLPHRSVYIARQLTPDDQQAVLQLGLPGVSLIPEDVRVYPQGRLAAHIVGRTKPGKGGMVGSAGTEERFNDILSDPTRSLTLALDIRVQHALREELVLSVARFRALGGVGLVLDVHTGEVVAMVSLPDFDPNRSEKLSRDHANRASYHLNEPGSVLKLLTAAVAIDQGKAELNTSYDATRPLRVSGRTIRDYRGQKRPLTTAEAIVNSSNIAVAMMAQDIGPRTLKRYLEDFGLLDATGIELPERRTPTAPRRWTPLATMTVGFGHGIAVSPLHTASAVSALANGGYLVPATLLKRTSPIHDMRRPVISPATSDKLRWLMRQVVLRGSGAKADNGDYPVGGKTGTAEKVVNGRYDRDRRYSSFVGVFPISQPRFAVFIAIDEPKGTEETFGYATGGWTAAPAVGAVIRRIGPMFGLPAAGPAADDWMRRIVPDAMLSKLFRET